MNIQQTLLYLLSRRDHSRLEVSRKLKTKGYSLAEIETALEQAVQSGFINDQRFAENYTRWRRAKGYGPLRIKVELRARGIDPQVIAEVIDLADNAWFIEAQRVLRKHAKSKLLTDFKQRAKHLRFLQYRGFTPEQINSLFAQAIDYEEVD